MGYRVDEVGALIFAPKEDEKEKDLLQVIEDIESLKKDISSLKRENTTLKKQIKEIKEGMTK